MFQTHLFPATTIEHSPLEAVYIYFDTVTFDEIERDEKVVLFNTSFHNDGDNLKVTMEAQLGLIGGTMGLLTGFSILSGVEIIYYLLKLVMSLRVSRTLMSGANIMFEKYLSKKD